MVMDELHLPYEQARELLLRHGSVRKAVDATLQAQDDSSKH